MSPLTCDTGDGDYSWYFFAPEDFTTLKTKRRQRCTSCRELIDVGATILLFECFRYPKEGSVEEKIVGEGNEVQMADKVMCEACGDQFMNLSALGFCLDIEENMFHLLDEYHREYGPKAKEE